jgi:hypothetical protein
MTQTTEVAEISPALIAQFAEMVGIVPDFEAGGGEGIIEQILSSRTLGDIDAPWSGGRKIPVGPMLLITDIAKTPSDYPGGLPFYLVVTTILPSSGETKEFTAGGTMVVAQLVKAYSLDEFPIAGEVVETPLKNRPGQSAQHFKVSREDTDRLRAHMAKVNGK